MALYTACSPMGARIKVIDHKTSEVLGRVSWLDTNWGLMKCYLVDPKTSRIKTKILPQRGGGVKFEPQFEYVQREVDLIDRRTNKLVHQIRLGEDVNGLQTVTDHNFMNNTTFLEYTGRLGD